MKRKGIGRKFIFYQIILGLILIICMGSIIGVTYSSYAVDTFNRNAVSYVKVVSEAIDGDKASTYLKTGKKDAYYYEILEFLNMFQKNTDMLYLYVMVPGEKNFTYIWDATSKGGYVDLGAVEEYAPNGANYAKEVFNKNPIEEARDLETDDWGEIVCCFYPVYNSNGDPVAIVGTDMSVEQINDNIVSFVVSAAVGIIIIISLFTFVLFSATNKKIIKPITVLRNASEKILQNLSKKETTKIPIDSKDEIGELARAYETMEDEIKKYMEQLVVTTAERERIGAELNVATKIQADMLPSVFPPFPGQDNFDILAAMAPAKEVGGDFYDFFKVDENHVALVIADVSGKGVPAALFMVIAKTMIKNRTMQGGTPSKILADVNNELCENNKEGFFVTVWLAIVDLKTGEVVSTNAGHEYPTVRPKDGKFELLVRKHNPPLAVMEDVKYEDNHFKIKPGDRLFVYTDGIPEIIDKKEEQFGTDRMLKSLNKKPGQDLDGLLTGLTQDIIKFVGDQEQFDDITMLAFDYYKKKK